MLYQVNTRVWLQALGETLGRPATLDDVPDDELDRLAARGFDWCYLLGVWRTGEAGRRVSRHDPRLRRELAATLPDLDDTDICGSCFAVTAYEVSPALGGDGALARLRDRLAARGMRLMLDAVPNHTALDHPWVTEHPEYYVAGGEQDLETRPQDVVRVGDRVLAHGRDPSFPGWRDTLQLDYANPDVPAAMIDELLAVARRADGIRCDMAMLLLPDVFERTWGRRPAPFWPAAIEELRRAHPQILLLAEVYWGRDRELQAQGFDVTYDKGLYDVLRDRQPQAVHEHLAADPATQRRSARFLENHDEARAAATFPLEVHRVAALVTYLTPGLRFVHQGQLEGRRVHVSPHLCRAPTEPDDPAVVAWYATLLRLLDDPIVHEGDWRLVGCTPAGQDTADAVLAWTWTLGERWWLVVVNLGPRSAACRIDLPDAAGGEVLELTDRLTGELHTWSVDERRTGLPVMLPGWGAQVLTT